MNTVASVLRADLPRLRTVLDVYAACLEQLVAELSAAGESVERRLSLLGHLRRDHTRILVDLERIVAVLDSTEREAVPFNRRLGTAISGIEGEEPSAARRSWRGRNRLRLEAQRRRRYTGEA